MTTSTSDGSASANQVSNSHVTDAMNRWSGSFWRLTVPSGLGAKCAVKRCADEGAKVLAMGVYMASRTGEVDAIPYDGSTYEGHTIADESKGTLWKYETAFPLGFEPKEGEKFLISLGHCFKCKACRGQKRVQCSACDGKVRWNETQGDKVVSYTCNCGDGKMDCHTCTGYGEMLTVIRVVTTYAFDEKKAKEYAGRLPEALLMGAAGNNIYRHVAEFDNEVITEAIDGFDADEYTHLMTEVHSQLKADVSVRTAGQMVDPQILHGLIDGYFRDLPNPVAANKRLKHEILPVRLRCEVTDVPVKAVTYEYKGREYALHVYGDDGNVWVEKDQPKEFTWKAALLLVLIFIVGLTVFLTMRH